MTGLLRAAGLVPEKARTSAWLTDGEPPDWMLYSLWGKEVVDAVHFA